MRISEIKPGLVYRYRRLGPLFLVVELYDKDGGHAWLNLETGCLGRASAYEMNYAAGANFQIPDFESSERQ